MSEIGVSPQGVLDKYKDVERVVALDSYKARYSSIDDRVYVNQGVHEIPLSTDCTLDFLGFLGAPQRFIKACEDANLLDQILGYCSSRNSQIQVLARNGIGVSVKSDDVPMLTTHDILSSIVTALKDNDPRFVGISVNGSLYVETITDRCSNPNSRETDVSYAGVSVYSNGRLLVSPSIYRVVCTNGLLHKTDCKIEFSVGSSREDVASSISQAVLESSNLARDQLLQQFIDTAEQEVGDPASLFAGLARDHHISSKLAEELIAIAPSRDGDTLYDAINLVTRHANSFIQEMRLQEARKLQRLGGILTCPTDRCNSCYRRLG